MAQELGTDFMNWRNVPRARDLFKKDNIVGELIGAGLSALGAPSKTMAAQQQSNISGAEVPPAMQYTGVVPGGTGVQGYQGNNPSSYQAPAQQTALPTVAQPTVQQVAQPSVQNPVIDAFAQNHPVLNSFAKYVFGSQ